jgi:hypothetical protein
MALMSKLYSKKPSLYRRLIEPRIVRHFQKVNRTKEWHQLSKWRAVFNLLAFRIELREHNLHNTDGDLTQPKPECPFHPDPPARFMRTESGTQNDLQYPAMGCRFSRLGRNVPRNLTAPDTARLLQPNPLLVSQQLLARRNGEFKPASSLNLLAAAWIQFQVHDWFGHEKHAVKQFDEPIDPTTELLVPQAGNWTDPRGMRLPRTKPDSEKLTDLDSQYPAYRNEDPQWWDGSQIYGEDEDETRELRSDPGGRLCASGHLYIDREGLLPTNPNTGTTVSGFTDNWWLGLELLHTLFAKEHNAICDHLKTHEAALSDEEIFEKARLINCAVMAKIHTIEWTPGILAHPAIKPALDANWMGLIGHSFGESLARSIAPLVPAGLRDLLTGIPLSDVDHHGAPYALTEEFASVYRLHPLLPEELEIQTVDGKRSVRFRMEDVAFTRARTPLSAEGFTMADVIYSFGTHHPGAITIHNYPTFLRTLKIPADPPDRLHEQILDLAAVDVLRDRERGVPRYNEFRQQLRKPPVRDFLELAGGDAQLAAELDRVYQGKLEDVDTIVGMFSEPLPVGFGFSDTAFRIFILMASRRLKSDRFFTTDYRAEFYTAAGLDWIRRTGMKEVILRHQPDLEFAFDGVANPFAPWTNKPPPSSR